MRKKEIIIFMEHPFDVTEAKKWAEYVKNCRAKGMAYSYQECEKQKS